MMKAKFLLILLLFGSKAFPCESTWYITGDTSVCEGINSGTLILKGFTGKVLYWERESSDEPGIWHTEDNLSNHISFQNLSHTTSYRARIKLGSCEERFSDTATVTVDKHTKGGWIKDTTVCNGSSGTLSLLENVGSVLQWQFKNQTDTLWKIISNTTSQYNFLKITPNSIYRAVVKNGACDTSFSLSDTIETYPLPQARFDVHDTCSSKAIRITNFSNISSGTLKCEWDYGDGTPVTESLYKKYNEHGNYTIKLYAKSDKSCVDSALKKIVVHPVPEVDFDLENVCYNEALRIINRTDSIPEGMQVSIDLGDGNSTIIPNPEYKYSEPGTYIIEYKATSNVGQCADSLTKTVKVYPLPNIEISNDTTISSGYSTNLFASGGITYNWLPIDGLSDPKIQYPIASPSRTTEYEVTVEDENFCVNRKKVRIEVADDYKIEPANLLTPDGNGKNDYWVIKNIETYSNATVMIFNRLGEEVYFSKAYQNKWDGRNKNRDILPDGTYFYVIKFPGTQKLYKGAITIIRNK